MSPQFNKISLSLLLILVLNLFITTSNADKILKVPLSIPQLNNYIKATIYLGTYLKPFEVNLEINSQYTWVRNSTCIFCKYNEKNDSGAQIISKKFAPVHQTLQKPFLTKKSKIHKLNNNNNNDLNKLKNDQDMSCEELQEKSYVCTGTCSSSDQVVKIPKEEGNMSAILVNDALGFNKFLQDIIFIDFGLVFKQEYHYINVKNNDKYNNNDKLEKVEEKQQVKYSRYEQREWEYKNAQGALGLPNSKNNIVYLMKEKGVIEKNMFSLYIPFTETSNLLPSLVFGGVDEKYMGSTFNYTSAINLDQNWGFQYVDIKVDSKSVLQTQLTTSNNNKNNKKDNKLKDSQNLKSRVNNLKKQLKNLQLEASNVTYSTGLILTRESSFSLPINQAFNLQQIWKEKNISSFIDENSYYLYYKVSSKEQQLPDCTVQFDSKGQIITIDGNKMMTDGESELQEGYFRSNIQVSEPYKSEGLATFGQKFHDDGKNLGKNFNETFLNRNQNLNEFVEQKAGKQQKQQKTLTEEEQIKLLNKNFVKNYMDKFGEEEGIVQLGFVVLEQFYLSFDLDNKKIGFSKVQLENESKSKAFGIKFFKSGMIVLSILGMMYLMMNRGLQIFYGKFIRYFGIGLQVQQQQKEKQNSIPQEGVYYVSQFNDNYNNNQQ